MHAVGWVILAVVVLCIVWYDPATGDREYRAE
jgi:hypothetical protein